MSNAVINPVGEIQSFASLLRPLTLHTTRAANAPKLGKTAQALEHVKEDARHEGLQQGYQEGFKAGKADGIRVAYEEAAAATQAEVARFTSELDGTGHLISEAMQRWYADSEEKLAELAVVIAARIVGKELATEPDTILAMTRQAIAEVTHASAARIRINPFDAPAIAEHQDAIMAVAPSLRNVEIVKDARIQGGCVIDTEGGIVDASVDSMLAEALAAIRGEA